MQPQFEIGQLVKHINEPDTEAGKVLGYSFTPDRGFVYTIYAKFLDIEKKEVLDGVKNLYENEMVAVKENKDVTPSKK